MFHFTSCVCLAILLRAASSTPEVDLPFDAGDTYFCDETMEVCENSVSGEDIDDASDYLGAHLLQTDIHLHRELKSKVKEVHISGEAEVESPAAQEPQVYQERPAVQISGGADVTSQHAAATEKSVQHVRELVEEEAAAVAESRQAYPPLSGFVTKRKSALLNEHSHGRTQPHTVGPEHATWMDRAHGFFKSRLFILIVAVSLLMLGSFYSIGAFSRKGLSARAAQDGPSVVYYPPLCQEKEGLEKKVLLEPKSSKISYGTTDDKGNSPNDGSPDDTPEWTTSPTQEQQSNCRPPTLNSPAQEKCEIDNVELRCAGVRFVLPPRSLDRLGSGHWTATGMSGKEFLRAAITDVPETGHSYLVISVCGTSGGFQQRWKFDKSPLTGTLPIFGAQDELWGTVEPIPGGRCLVKQNGQVIMLLDISNHADLCAKASDSAGRAMATSFKTTQPGCITTGAPESGETWKLQCKPEVDSVFVAGCMLAHMLLGAGAGTGTPAFAKLNK